MDLMELEDRETMQHIIVLRLLIAFGNSKLLRKEIEKVYATNKFEYYEAAQKAEIRKSKLIHTFPSAVTESILKAAGIYFWSFFNEDFKIIERFLKIGFGRVFEYTAKSEKIFLPGFMPFLFKTTKEVHKFSEQELADMYSVLYWLCLVSGKPCELGNLADDTRLSIDRTYYGNVGQNGDFLKSLTEKYKVNIKNLKQIYCPDTKKQKKKSLDLLFYHITEKEALNIPAISSKALHERKKLEPLLIKMGISKYIYTFSKLINLMGIDCSALEQIEMTNNEYNQLFALFYLSQEDYGIPQSERDIFLVSAIYMKALIKEYQETRQVHLANAHEENYFDTIMLKKEIDEKERALRKEETCYKSENDSLKAKIDQLQAEALVADREAIRLKREIEESEFNKKELLALREFMFGQSTDASSDIAAEPEVFDKALNSLKTKSCAVIGGHPNWVKKMKEILPNYTYIDVDSLNKDLKYLEKKDIVFINTDYNSHGLYYKIVSQLENSSTKLHFTGGTSVQSSIMAMAKALD